MSRTAPSLPDRAAGAGIFPHERSSLQHDPSQGVSDAILAGSLVTAPAWSVPLSEVNALLTTLSLVVGLVIGAARLWHLLREKH